MALVTQTGSPERHIVGDMSLRFYNLSGGNGDTFVVPQDTVLQVVATPTTAIAVGATVSGRTITFVTAGAWAAKVGIFTRVG